MAFLQLASLVQVTGLASTAYGVRRLPVARRARRLRRTRGFTYEEALQEGLLDPRLPDAEVANSVSKDLMLKIQARVNPPELMPLTEEKAIFSIVCTAAGLPAPRVLAVVGRSGGWAGSRAIERPGDFARLVDELPDEFVVKPSAGYHGAGVALIHKRGDELVDHEGRAMTPAALHARMADDERFGLFLVQERVHNHPEIRAHFGTETLQTLRLMTYVDRAGEPRLLYGVARIASGGGPVDNIGEGQHGNRYAVISLADGRLGPARSAGHGDDAPAAPDCDGFALPLWEEARALALHAARAVLPLRAIGWDVALAPGGPVLIEANAAFDPWPGDTFGRAVAVIGTE